MDTHSLLRPSRGRRRYDINVYAGELEVRPRGAPTTPGRGAQRRSILETPQCYECRACLAQILDLFAKDRCRMRPINRRQIGNLGLNARVVYSACHEQHCQQNRHCLHGPTGDEWSHLVHVSGQGRHPAVDDCIDIGGSARATRGMAYEARDWTLRIRRDIGDVCRPGHPVRCGDHRHATDHGRHQAFKECSSNSRTGDQPSDIQETERPISHRR